jgi:hypothetical protein
MGICNIFARVNSFNAPMIAELQSPWPMISVMTLSICSLVASQFIREDDINGGKEQLKESLLKEKYSQNSTENQGKYTT